MKNSKEPAPLDPDTFPHKPRHGQLPATIENMERVLEGYGIAVEYDVIKKKLLITSAISPATSDNADNTAMAHVVSLACLNRFPRNNIELYVAAIGDAHPVNPVKNWILSKPWDGKDRLPAMYPTLTVQEDVPPELKEVLIHKWLLSAVAAALLDKHFRGRGVLTLQGPQGLGKTQWVARLVPAGPLRDLLVNLDHHLDPHQKDSVFAAISHWINELGELESLMRRDIHRLKGFLTRDRDKLRRPYDRTPSEMPRRTVFIATVNEAKFLADDTGNSRWWTLPVTHVDWQHCVDMQQLWAQLAEELGKGGEWWLTKDEEQLLAEYNRRHRTVSAIEEMVLDALDLEFEDLWDCPALTPRQLLVLLGIAFPSNPQCKECGAVLREYLGDPKRIQGRDRWRVPLLPIWREKWNDEQPRQRRDKFD